MFSEEEFYRTRLKIDCRLKVLRAPMDDIRFRYQQEAFLHRRLRTTATPEWR